MSPEVADRVLVRRSYLTEALHLVKEAEGLLRETGHDIYWFNQAGRWLERVEELKAKDMTPERHGPPEGT